jgi:ABC-type nitrate/sulfonate/bicarbonate transport system permease component
LDLSPFPGAVFPLLINTYAGVKNVNRVLVNVVQSFGASEWQLLKIVVLPNAVPYIIAGLRFMAKRGEPPDVFPLRCIHF